MNQFLAFVRKELYHVLRDKKSLLILFGLPVVQIMLFGFALTNEIKQSKIGIVDNARDEGSRQLIEKIRGNVYFEVGESVQTPESVEAAFKRGKIKLAVIIPAGFNNDLLHLNKAQVQIIADASDPNTAATLTNYMTAIIRDYQDGLRTRSAAPYTITSEVRMFYNPQLLGAPNFVPGVMALVLLLVCVMMTAASIVREKEFGTMEVLLVSPARPLSIILSKAVPYLLLSIVNLVVILLLSVYALDLPIRGSIILLFGESVLFIITALALGLLISANTNSQQIAMIQSILLTVLPGMLLTGFLFPIENMPLPLRIISNVVPAKWYYTIVKSIMLKGLGLDALWAPTAILAGMAVLLIGISLSKFKIRLA